MVQSIPKNASDEFLAGQHEAIKLRMRRGMMHWVDREGAIGAREGVGVEGSVSCAGRVGVGGVPARRGCREEVLQAVEPCEPLLLDLRQGTAEPLRQARCTGDIILGCLITRVLPRNLRRLGIFEVRVDARS